MEFDMTAFANDKFKILKTIYDNTVSVGDDRYAPLTQIQVAELAGFAKPKTNQLMQQLTTGGYIALFKGQRGKYIVTDEGNYVVRCFLHDRSE